VQQKYLSEWQTTEKAGNQSRHKIQGRKGVKGKEAGVLVFVEAWGVKSSVPGGIPLMGYVNIFNAFEGKEKDLV